MEGKKSFILYADLLVNIALLSDEQAGKVFKHLLQYVNDLNPEAEDLLTNVIVTPIKSQLKKDLEKWKGKREINSMAGKASAAARAQRKLELENSEPKSKPEKDPIKKREPKILMKDVTESNENDFTDESEKGYFKAARALYLALKSNSEDRLKVRWNGLYKVSLSECMKDVRLMYTQDKRTSEDFINVFRLITSEKTDDAIFWAKTIQSTGSLRRNFDKLITAAKHSNNANTTTKPKESIFSPLRKRRANSEGE